MHYRELGATGLRVSAIAFGGAPIGLANYLDEWDPHSPLHEAQAIAAIQKACEVGITYFDTALGYGQGRSEHIMGKALRQAGAVGKQAILATKTPKRTYDEVLQSAEQSLANLSVDVIDVLQFHGGRWSDDDATSVLEGGGLDAFQELKRAGKIRFLGFTAETASPGTFRLIRSGQFDVMQMAYNVLYQDACNLMVKSGPIIEAKERRMGVVTMRSLTSGVFQKLIAAQLPSLAEQLDLYAFCLNYVLSNPYVDSAIVGMRLAEEVERNARIVDQTAMRLDLEEVHRRYV